MSSSSSSPSPSPSSSAPAPAPAAGFDFCLIIQRHGVRLPVKPITWSRRWSKLSNFVSQYRGYLVSAGYRQIGRIAEQLVQQYGDMRIVVRSTNKQRTIETAHTFARAVPAVRHLTLHVSDCMTGRPHADADTVRAAKCFKHELYERHRSEVTIVDNELRLRLYKMTGLEGFSDGVAASKHVKAIRFMCTAMRIEAAIGMPVMHNRNHIRLTTDEMSTIERVRARGYHVGCGTTAREVRAHGYLGTTDVVAALRALLDYHGPPLLYYYAAHDTTLMAIMSLFGYTNFIIPEFAALIILEKLSTGIRLKYVPRPDIDLAGGTYRLPASPDELADMPSSCLPGVTGVTGVTGVPGVTGLNNLADLMTAIDYCPVCAGKHDPSSSLQMTKMYEGWLTPRCAVCGQANPDNACTHCKRVWYCSPSCQKTHWPTHRLECIKIM
jgi:hypothetical protein